MLESEETPEDTTDADTAAEDPDPPEAEAEATGEAGTSAAQDPETTEAGVSRKEGQDFFVSDESTVVDEGGGEGGAEPTDAPDVADADKHPTTKLMLDPEEADKPLPG